MSTIINGSSPSITFSDSTTQTTAFTGSASQITSGTLPSAQLPTGSVLQVVQGTTTTAVSVSNSTLTDTTLSASITPKFSTSKILVIVNHADCYKAGSNANNDITIHLLRNSTDIWSFSQAAGYGAPYASIFNVSGAYLDSPATTSSITYKTQFKNADGNTTVQVQSNSTLSPSTIILMEIA